MTDDRYPNNVEVHRWAQDQPWGHKVPATYWTRSATFPHVIAAWNKAHPDRPYVKSEAHHGTPSGYNCRNCRCDRCKAAINAYQRDTRVGRSSTRGD